MRKTKNRLSKIFAAGIAAVTALCGGVLPLDEASYIIKASAAGSVTINAANFPDKNFRALLKTPTYDQDGNGVLDAQELLELRNIYADDMGIKTLKGIELLPELRGIYCSDNELTELDISSNTLLTGVWCASNKLTKLDMSNNHDLLWLYCFDNQITSLDFKPTPDMAYLECNDNPLTGLDVSPCKELEHLICNSCGLKKLDLSANTNLTHLDALRNKFTPNTLNISECKDLKRLDIWDNNDLGNFDISMFEGLQYYNCAANGVTELDVSHNPYLTKLNCAYNSIDKLDLSSNSRLVYLDCACNDIDKLDISSCPNMRFLQAFTNPFTTLNIGDCEALVKTYNEGVKVYEGGVCKGHSWTINYGEDDSTGGDSKLFLCFDDKVSLSTAPTKPAPEAPVEQVPANTSNLTTREEFVQRLYELAGSPAVSVKKSRFTDVQVSSKYAKALIWGENNNICTGYPYKTSDTFGVGKYLSRQDAVLMLMRFSEVMGFKRSIDFGRSDDYLDYYDIDFDHWEAVCWSATYNIMEGKGEPGAPKEEQRIDPLGKATKAELNFMLDNLADANKVPSLAKHTPGDVNGDEEVTVKDITLLKQHLAYWSVTIIEMNGNVNGDKAITVKDVTQIQQKLANWNVTLT